MKYYRWSKGLPLLDFFISSTYGTDGNFCRHYCFYFSVLLEVMFTFLFPQSSKLVNKKRIWKEKHYLSLNIILKGASGTLQDVVAASREGAEIAQRAYRETTENSVSLDPCLKAAQKAYSQFCIENNVAPSRLTPSNTDEMRQRICVSKQQ